MLNLLKPLWFLVCLVMFTACFGFAMNVPVATARDLIPVAVAIVCAMVWVVLFLVALSEEPL
jgi:hypothetical protein